MKGIARFKLLSIILAISYVLSACSGAAVQTDTSTGGGKPQSMEVSFTGTVESINSGTITVSGQTVSLDAKTILDPNIQVGDIVKVEAQVSESGDVLGLKVETFRAEDTANVNANTNDGNTNGDNSNSNTNPDNSNTNTNNDNTNGNGNSNTNANDNGNTTGQAEQEIFGTVEALSADSVTVNGVVYQFASFTELKDAIFVGDEVKLHVIVNADGSFSVREIERSAGRTGDDDNSNGNGNSNDDDDDNSNGNSNGNSNEDDDDDDDDDNSNSNSNGNGNGS